ncbi:hypothetical protein H0H92_004350 [Tricholoma furcatifolium]|nr:hypothetical protein H0H92_004350 [Tricholoma furcatifolium]
MTDIAQNQGALLLGGFIAAGLSGMVAVQALLYFKLYPLDPPILKTLVTFLWALDSTHSGLVIASVWNYVIQGFGNAGEIDDIPVVLSITIIFTVRDSFHPGSMFRFLNVAQAILTFIVHCEQKKLDCDDTYSLACDLSAMFRSWIRIQTFSSFKAQFRWLFSLGLALSSIVDILITLCLFALLRKSRTQSMNLDQIIDSLILYAFEVGFLTCAGTIASMICWLSMNDNLIFMGLYFVIAKLYTNSLLAALNTRHHLRSRRRQPSRDTSAPTLDLRRRETFRAGSPYMVDPEISLQHVHINIEKSITYDPLSPGSSTQEV